MYYMCYIIYYAYYYIYDKYNNKYYDYTKHDYIIIIIILFLVIVGITFIVEKRFYCYCQQCQHYNIIIFFTNKKYPL